jgi:predicted nucleic acid-binding protein
MSRLLLDTSVLIRHWHRLSGGQITSKAESDARGWANRLIDLQKTSNVATPVVIEFLAGARTAHELSLFRAYLEQFDIIDRGEILRDDWDLARRIAERVPRDGKPRQLGDCLIRAIAKRFRCDVITSDDRFP